MGEIAALAKQAYFEGVALNDDRVLSKMALDCELYYVYRALQATPTATLKTLRRTSKRLINAEQMPRTRASLDA